jgi:hypothetical protein
MAAVFSVLSEKASLYRNSDILVDRAGMCLFLADPELGQKIENDTGFYFKFPRQLVYPNFLHRGDC